MEWSKIKNIVILILLFVNAALLVLVASRESRRAHSEAETWAGTIAALERSGISFSLPAPPPMELAPLTFTRDREGERSAAEALLGPLEEQADSSPARTSYAASAGHAEFSMDGEFILRLEPDVWLLNGRSYDQASQDALERLGFAGILLEEREEAGRRVLRYCQAWEGAPLFSCRTELCWQDGSLLSVQGQRMAGTAAPAAGGSVLPTADILIRFLAGLNQAGDVCSRIDAMTGGYLVNSNSRPIQLLPAWLVETDNRSYYVNGLTGEVSPAE